MKFFWLDGPIGYEIELNTGGEWRESGRPADQGSISRVEVPSSATPALHDGELAGAGTKLVEKDIQDFGLLT